MKLKQHKFWELGTHRTRPLSAFVESQVNNPVAVLFICTYASPSKPLAGCLASLFARNLLCSGISVRQVNSSQLKLDHPSTSPQGPKLSPSMVWMSFFRAGL